MDQNVASQRKRTRKAVPRHRSGPENRGIAIALALWRQQCSCGVGLGPPKPEATLLRER